MKKRIRWIAVAAFIGLVFFAGVAPGQEAPQNDKSLSPFFFVKSDDHGLDQLPLKSTSAKVRIAGVIADVTVTQVYRNEGKRPLEALYVFPASTRAAVYGMTMTVGERTITARIAKREEARQEYEAAKQAGRSASLLEQQRPNVFQMNVANILPGDLIQVELKYTELLVPTDGIYEFSYPTVVGPRYSNQRAEGAEPSEGWIENPYLHQGEAPTYAFHMAIDLSAGLPVQNVVSPSHKIQTSFKGPDFCSIDLAPSEKDGGNRDFILKYRLAGNRVQTGLLLFEGKEENFFLLMIQPPKRVNEKEIPPREYIFIVDVSGSMHGFPLDISKKLLKDLIACLRPEDRFNVLLFAGGSSLMSGESLPAVPENVNRAVALLERQRGGGGTELIPALQRALSLPKKEGFSRTIVIATDGYVSVEAHAFDLIRQNLANANLFPFGIGSSVNRYLIEGMARAGMGEPYIVLKPQEAPDKARKFRELIQTPVLTGLKMDFKGFEAYDVEPPSIPDLMADRPLIIFGKWHGRAQGNIDLRGHHGDRPFHAVVDVQGAKHLDQNSALPYLWARHRIAVLSDFVRLSPQDERITEVTNLGLTYNLLTAYTSFVAIDNLVRTVNGEPVTVRQPLPLPQGVSDHAVGRGGVMMKTAAPIAEASGPRADKEGRYLQAADEKGLWRLKSINVPDGLDEKVVRAEIEKNLSTLNDSCGFYLKQARASSVTEIKLVLEVGIDGRVKTVMADSKSEWAVKFENCLKAKLLGLQLTAQANHSGGKVEMILILT